MPQNQEHHTKLNGRVRIKGEVTHMYPNARVYNEGIVKKQIHDELGYPLIWVEWDKDHWAYSGEKDGLVLEAHFEPVEENMADDKNNDDLIQSLLKVVEQYNQDKAEKEKIVKPDTRPTGDPTFESTLANAVADAEEAEAFVILVAKNIEGTDLLMPQMYVHSHSDDAALMLEATLADHVSLTMTRMVQEMSRRLHEDGSAGS